ncbi:YppG family protein [Oceanobacillus senegalensis]|uniref:YppG family protein n=1 Tax=Oceanobacillus senegalensis TaxID=1936063 RepID=UPI000A306BC2|nr:YppG family protein [Oceanobacillus senegalensis]
MFPERPRRPARPIRPAPPRPKHDPFQLRPRHKKQMEPKQGQLSNVRHLLAMFQTSDGNIDMEKLMGTAGQINDLYKQVSPMISKFIKK